MVYGFRTEGSTIFHDDGDDDEEEDNKEIDDEKASYNLFECCCFVWIVCGR